MHAPQSDDVAWWRSAVVYQVYLRSFCDGDGDGFGDIAGLRARLHYLQELGVDALWLNPWYRSPMHDGGYDVSDYFAINPVFGDMAAAEELIADCHRLGLRIIVDLVPNHTSSEHQWFQDALAAPPGSRERHRYIFVDGGENGPPNNWRSVFGGPAWSQVADGQWYLHLFDAEQPDLNWSDPEVAAMFIDVLRFWLERDVDGFRVDVAHGLVKDPSFPDVERTVELLHEADLDDHPHWDRDGIHPIVRSWRAVVDEYPDKMLVAEAWVHPERLSDYLRPDEYHQSFNFELLEADWDADVFAAVIERSLRIADGVGATSTWVLSNHDVVRPASRYGLREPRRWRRWLTQTDPELPDLVVGTRRARAAALLLMALPGSMYIYQGEELGLAEVIELPDHRRDDPVWRRSKGTDRGRDGCRVPIPWHAGLPGFGFSSGEPWLPQPDWFAPYAVDVQLGDAESTLELFRRGLAARRAHLRDGDAFEFLEAPRGVLALRRGSRLLCTTNMSTNPVRLPPGAIILASGPIDDGLLAPDTTVWTLTAPEG